jgi:membrane-associated phospholipid phosphatase
MTIPLAIALARIYVNAHYLSDVVAGALIGVACAIVVWNLMILRGSNSEAAAKGAVP